MSLFSDHSLSQSLTSGPFFNLITRRTLNLTCTSLYSFPLPAPPHSPLPPSQAGSCRIGSPPIVKPVKTLLLWQSSKRSKPHRVEELVVRSGTRIIKKGQIPEFCLQGEVLEQWAYCIIPAHWFWGPKLSKTREGKPAAGNSKKHQHVCTSWREISSEFWEHLVTSVFTYVWCVKASAHPKDIHSEVDIVSLYFLVKKMFPTFFLIYKILYIVKKLENTKKYT